MAHEPEVSGFNIVLLGHFNPSIFSPLWLHTTGLITPGELESSSIIAIVPELSNFRTNNFEFLIDRERFQISRVGPAEITVFDFVMRLFGEFLTHTTLRQAGINWEAHYRSASWKSLHAIGDVLAPKAPWGSWSDELLESGSERGHRKGGLISLTMGQTVRNDGAKGAIRFTVEPSTKVQPGLYLRLNDHFEVDDQANVVGALPLMKILNDKFDASRLHNQELSETVLRIGD